jgi:hypothetical protein
MTTPIELQSATMPRPSCRLFVILGRDAPTALILRRGPSKWYHLVRWRMDSDTFERGAWFHGRIYEERCDLSPDGNLVVCFCHGGACRPGYTDSWTAVSRAPWLHALALWPWGTTYGGGGRFVDNRRLILHVNMPVETHPDHPAYGIEVIQGSAEYHRSSAEVDGADWSGRDHAGCLIFSQHGKLYRRYQGGDREIADFNGLHPDPRQAPDWAKEPLAEFQIP